MNTLMKLIRSLSLFALPALFAANQPVGPITPATLPEPPSATKDDGSGPRMPPERIQAIVIKVYAAQDGDARFRAYVIEWKGQEVIASDPLAKTDYKVGDTITVLAMNHPYPKGQEPHRLLAFSVMPPPRGR